MSSNVMAVLKNTQGWQEWMGNWIETDYYSVGNGQSITIYLCYHPDYECFLVTSDPHEAINGFTKYPYEY